MALSENQVSIGQQMSIIIVLLNISPFVGVHVSIFRHQTGGTPFLHPFLEDSPSIPHPSGVSFSSLRKAAPWPGWHLQRRPTPVRFHRRSAGHRDLRTWRAATAGDRIRPPGKNGGGKGTETLKVGGFGVFRELCHVVSRDVEVKFSGIRGETAVFAEHWL